MEHNLPFGYSGWEFWSTAEDFPFILEIFQLDKLKKPYLLTKISGLFCKCYNLLAEDLQKENP